MIARTLNLIDSVLPVGQKMGLANVLGFIFSLLETYLFIGVFYGWHEINRVLKVSFIKQSPKDLPV